MLLCKCILYPSLVMSQRTLVLVVNGVSETCEHTETTARVLRLWWFLLSFCAAVIKRLLRCSAEDLLPFGFPSIDMGPQLKVVERTRTATMLCAASGIPDPEISWFKDFLPVEPALSQGRIKQLRSGTADTSETFSSYEL